MVNRHAKAVLTVAALIAVGCAVAPRVVTVVQSYVATLPLDSTNARQLGTMQCDMAGQPVIYIHPLLSPERKAWVRTHELVHVEQARQAGGCVSFTQRMLNDSLFRLQQEGEAFCGVLTAQRQMRVKPEPDYPEIFTLLLERYFAEYDSNAVRSALPCR